MNCEQYRTGIEETDFAAGRPAARSGRSDAHAAACDECRGFGQETAALRGLVGGLARVDAPPDFEFRLRARIRAADSAHARSWPRALWPRAAWLAAAGCLALAAALALQTRISQTPGARGTDALQATAQPATVTPAANTSAASTVSAATTNAAINDVADERVVEAAATQSSASTAGLNRAVVIRRGVRAVSVTTAANAARTGERKAATAARPFVETVAAGGGREGQMETTTSSMIGSPVIVSSAIPLPVSADERPLQVLFNDMNGGSRVVNVDPVTFGSNEPAARPTNVTFTKAAKKQQGVW